jgi:hypothetical protein
LGVDCGNVKRQPQIRHGGIVADRSPRIAAPLATQPLPITAILPTIRGYSDARPAIERIVPQAVAAGGELIVADGSGAPSPSPEQLAELGGDVIRWLSVPGASVFQLRLAAYRQARGDVVAVTEDHCYVDGAWIERILAAHGRYPDAAAVGGAVLNGTDEKLVDWAAFVLTQGPFMPPLANGVASRISGPANVSYKRRVLARIHGDDSYGLIDFLELPDAIDGQALVNDDAIRVVHHQSQGFWGTSRAEFDNGRTIAGYRRRKMSRGDWARIATWSVLPIYRSVRMWRIVRGKERPPRMLLRSAPAHVWLQYCAMGGELLGYAAGPGESPRRLL